MTNIRTGTTAAAIAIVLALGPAACATSDSAVPPAAGSAPSDAAGIRVSESALPVQHVTMSTPKRFADVKRDM